jgi:hypothetical protein
LHFSKYKSGAFLGYPKIAVFGSKSHFLQNITFPYILALYIFLTKTKREAQTPKTIGFWGYEYCGINFGYKNRPKKGVKRGVFTQKKGNFNGHETAQKHKKPQKP